MTAEHFLHYKRRGSYVAGFSASPLPWTYDGRPLDYRGWLGPTTTRPLTVPAEPWSRDLRYLQSPDQLRQQRSVDLVLLNFVARLAREQIRGGRHFVFLLPALSSAWRAPALKRLRGHPGLHTTTAAGKRLLTSSQAVVSKLLDASVVRRCLKVKVALAQALVQAFEDEFDFETRRLGLLAPVHESFQVTSVPGAVDFHHDILAVTEAEPEADQGDFDFEQESADEPTEPFKGEITPAIRAAVKRVHEATGHRPPRRLARALLLSGAPPAAVQAARELKCDVCAERRAPRSRRVASLPAPRAVGEQMHVDLLVTEDAVGRTYVVAHATDAVSKFQQAAIIKDKSAASVIDFLMASWVPLLGPPKQLIADQGREFIAEEFQEWCSSHSILLWHAAVQAPWQNGIAERSGGTLKALVSAVVADKVVIGERDMSHAVSEAVSAYNSDPTAEGVSPLQCVTGRQPASQGSVLSNFAGRLAEHGLIDSDPSLNQRLALRESARIAMVRLHYSQSIRKVELARSREPTTSQPPAPGDVVYFWRAQKMTRRNDPRLSTSSRRRRLELKRWHGPAVLIALETSGETGFPSNAFLSFKGQVTKCALEHVRAASSLEQLAANTWEEAIKELVDGIDRSAGRGPGADILPVVPEDEALAEDVVVEPVVLRNVAPTTRPPSSLPTTSTTTSSAPSTAAPGTPVGQLLQRPVVQRALHRARQQPLEVELGRQALNRGQPAVFQAELRDAMVRGMRRRTSSEAGFDDGPAEVRRTALEQSVASGAPAVPRQPSNESPGQLLSEQAPAVPQQPSSESPGQLQSEQAPAVPRQPSSESPGPLPMSLSVQPQSGPRGAFEAMVLSRDELENLTAFSQQVHPLLQLQAQVEKDRQSVSACLEDERGHGTWDGRWSLPSSSQFSVIQAAGAMLPTGLPQDFEVSAATARKEYTWGRMSEHEKRLWSKAADKGWQAYLENDAVRILDAKESSAVRKQLAAKGELDRILVPRFVLTDKADGLRSENNPLEVEASARLVVPGFKDRANLNGEVRRDAPTGARLTQHLLLSLIASKGRSWKMMSADVKSAFLKGDPYVSRELYITRTNAKVGPSIPIPEGCLAKVCKGIFGLADAPREWWLRLSRALESRGWLRNPLDQASWFLWGGADKKVLQGMIISHVDDLLFGGNPTAEASLFEVGQELGFRETKVDDFVWCGKRFLRRPDGSVSLSMEAYHRNLKPIPVPKDRRASLTSPLRPDERRRLRALLGSFQWLVAQLRFDLQFPVSALQGETPTVGTMLRANALLEEFMLDPTYEMVFQPIPMEDAGLVVVTDSSLGNVTQGGAGDAPPLEKVYSQSCYFCLLADRDLREGRPGRFNVLDTRSHRLTRVCRSSYSAETLGAEEAFDVGQLARGFLAAAKGYPLHSKQDIDRSLNAVPLTVVVDAKDVFDKGNSDTSSFGSQKSLAFTVAWLRAMLRRPNTVLRWTATSNLFCDAGTKYMDVGHLRSTLRRGVWSIEYSPTFVKQVSKGKRVVVPKVPEGVKLPGASVDGGDPLLGFLLKFAEDRGWHHQGSMGVNVSHGAKSFRTPEPRFSSAEFPLRTTFGRYELPSGELAWRVLERKNRYLEEANQHSLLPLPAPVLVTFFSRDNIPSGFDPEEDVVNIKDLYLAGRLHPKKGHFQIDADGSSSIHEDGVNLRLDPGTFPSPLSGDNDLYMNLAGYSCSKFWGTLRITKDRPEGAKGITFFAFQDNKTVASVLVGGKVKRDFGFQYRLNPKANNMTIRVHDHGTPDKDFFEVEAYLSCKVDCGGRALDTDSGSCESLGHDQVRCELAADPHGRPCQWNGASCLSIASGRCSRETLCFEVLDGYSECTSRNEGFQSCAQRTNEKGTLCGWKDREQKCFTSTFNCKAAHGPHNQMTTTPHSTYQEYVTDGKNDAYKMLS
ncbi:Uncharacterized protein K02A2.6 [Symbiodinium microadriaticum]|uniref:Uncharacterized protein K02A2.6 n=1 Tax=Symbiodinium microadriaticum TaxID=2951 RepID=A0A1Q9EC28_SYMMI|nr:Uncharacterized protein K02A2.6 [Symbiodinium microadriaticum]